MIRTILFDLDDTLIDRRGAHRRYCVDLIARRPDVFHPASADQILLTLLGADDEDSRTFARRATRAFPALSRSASLAADHARRLPAFVRPDRTITTLLECLRARYRLGVVSNGRGTTQRAKLAAAGLSELVACACISGDERVAKPDPGLFAKALARLDASPAETLYVGNDPATDVVGAIRAGMQTCWISHGRAYPESAPRPDYAVSSLVRLPEIFS